MPVYDTHVIIHLCVLKDFNECSVDTKELRSVIVGVDSVVQKSTLFRKSVRVIHTLAGVLKEGKRVGLDINQHFEEV